MATTTVYALLGYPLILIAGFELLLGFILLKQNPNSSPVNRTVATLAFFSSAFALCTGLMYLQASHGLDYNYYARVNWIGWFTLPPALQFLFYMSDEKSRAARLIGYILYPLWTIMLGLSIFTDLIVTRAYTLIPFSNQPGPLDKPLRLIGACLALWIIFQVFRLRRKATGIIKKELSLFFYGVLLFGGGAGITSGLLQLFGGFGLEPGLGSYFSLPWVALTFYAVARYNLFDIRPIISQTISTLLLLLIFAVAQMGFHIVFEPILGTFLSLLLSLPLIVYVFYATPFSRLTQEWINRIVLKDRYRYQEVLRSSTNAMATILNLDELLRHILSSVRTSLGIERACLYLSGPDGRFTAHEGPCAASGEADRPVLPDNVVQWVLRTRQTMVRSLIGTPAPQQAASDLLDTLRLMDTEVLVPIFYQSELRGALCLDARGNGEFYTQSDILLLETLAGHAAVAIQNALLFKETVRVKEYLQESEEKFRSLAETAAVAIFIHQGGNFLYTNKTAETLGGYRTEEYLSMNFLSLAHPDYVEMITTRARERLKSGQPPAQYEFRIVRKDGSERWVLMTAGITLFDRKPAVIGTLIDITERKDLEGKVSYMRRMEALGKLAGGVAHDFNNILTTIVGHGSLLRAKIQTADPLQKHVDQILASTERAAALTQRLMTYGSRKEAALLPCDLSALVSHQKRFLTGILRDNVELTVLTCADPLPVLADNGQLERVIMNLVANARDAMPDGGDIVIEAGRTMMDGDFIRTRGFGNSGPYAYISVRDSGTGMNDTVKARIFEPFFTTKDKGKGTGFGLSIVYDIIKDHKGYIEVISSPGQGTTFLIYFPIREAVLQKTLPVSLPQGGRETILLVEDEETPRKYARTILEECGYTVLEAADGREALQIYAQKRDAVHLVISDMTMPNMNGGELYQAIKKLRPDALVLFVSGYAEDLLRQTGFLDHGQPFLFKPINQKALLSKVRTLLDSAQPSA